jgi:hypothetical protein
MAKEVTAAERSGLFSHDWQEVSVYGSGTASVPVQVDGFTPSPSGPFRRSGYEVEADAGAKHVYVMVWRGDAGPLLDYPLRPGTVVVKPGASSKPERRVAELRGGFPCPAHIGWTMYRTSDEDGLGPFEARSARSLEVELQRGLSTRGRSLRGEFFLIQENELVDSWSSAMQSVRAVQTSPVLRGRTDTSDIGRQRYS